jgi:hypothetical protein
MNVMKHVIILPYHDESEVHRYLAIAALWKSLTRTAVPYEVLLASSRTMPPSESLQQAFSTIAPTTVMRCQNRVTGYPSGPTAMFWEIMDHVAGLEDDGGFALWLESDMIPVKSYWLDRLDQCWHVQAEPLMMGRYVPSIYGHKWRILWPKLVVREHINGGACYAKKLAHRLPASAREGLFDVKVFPFAQRLGQAVAVNCIDFSTLDTLPRDVQAAEKVLLHGWQQDKTKFIAECIRLARSTTPTSSTFAMPKASTARCCQFGDVRGNRHYCPVHTPLDTPRGFRRYFAAANGLSLASV